MLQKTLYQLIQQKGIVSLSELHQVSEDAGHKQSYAERQLRILSEGFKIKPVKNGKGHITHYRYQNSEIQKDSLDFYTLYNESVEDVFKQQKLI